MDPTAPIFSLDQRRGTHHNWSLAKEHLAGGPSIWQQYSKRMAMAGSFPWMAEPASSVI